MTGNCSLAKICGCPMVLSKLRKDSKCKVCRKELPTGEKAFRSLLDGNVGGFQRNDRVCYDCMKARGVPFHGLAF